MQYSLRRNINICESQDLTIQTLSSVMVTSSSCIQRLTDFVKGCRFLSIIIKGLEMLFISRILTKCGDWHDVRSFDSWEKNGSRVKRFGFLSYQSQEQI